MSTANVLIVDDNAGNRAAFFSILEPLGHGLVLADSGLKALEEALRSDFAAILLDVRMPDLDGLQVAGILRARERSRYTPIIFVSAFEATPAMVADARLVGAVDYLFSPVDSDLLRLKVAAFADLYLNEARLREAYQAVESQNLALKSRIHRLEKENSRLSTSR